MSRFAHQFAVASLAAEQLRQSGLVDRASVTVLETVGLRGWPVESFIAVDGVNADNAVESITEYLRASLEPVAGPCNVCGRLILGTVCVFVTVAGVQS